MRHKDNKKIKNATSTTYDNMTFKSLQERSCYRQLVEAGFSPEYEKVTFTIWKGFKPSVSFYTSSSKKSRTLKCNLTKLQDITYTPDFTFWYKDLFVIIEVKGFANDTYPIKRKLFRHLLEMDSGKTIFFEVYNKQDVEQAIEIIKNYEYSSRENTQSNDQSS